MSNEIEHSKDKAEQGEAKSLGRGTLMITSAKLWFILSGMGLLIFLPRIGGSSDEERAALFGTYTVLVGILNPFTMMMITGTIQAISKFVSENPSRYKTVIQKALLLQFMLGATVALLFAAFAPFIADKMGDRSLISPLRIASPIIFLYSLYAAFVGGFNGTKRFSYQALMDICFATLKVGLILGLVYMGFGIEGAIGGFASTALLMTVISGLLTINFLRKEKDVTKDITIKKILAFEFWIMIFALAFNSLMNVDLYIVKALTEEASKVGVYSAGLQVARLPYVAVISVTFVLFPLISNATYTEDLTKTREYIYSATRYALLIVGILAFTVAACSEDVLRLIFPKLFIDGKLQLAFLALAYMGFSLLAIFCTIITSAGKPQVSTLLVITTLATSAGLTYLGMTNYGQDGAAFAVMIAMFIGAAIAMMYIRSWLQAKLPFATLFRLILAGAIVAGLSMLWIPEAKLLIMVKGASLTMLFVIILIITKEFTAEDKSRFMKVLGR